MFQSHSTVMLMRKNERLHWLLNAGYFGIAFAALAVLTAANASILASASLPALLLASTVCLYGFLFVVSVAGSLSTFTNRSVRADYVMPTWTNRALRALTLILPLPIAFFLVANQPQISTPGEQARIAVPRSLDSLNWEHTVLCLIEAGELDSALSACDSLISVSPDYARAYQLRAYVNTKLNKAIAAIKDLEQATRLDPSDATILVDLECNCIFAGRYERSLELATRLDNLARGANAYLSLERKNAILAQLELGHHEDVIKTLDTMIRNQDTGDWISLGPVYSLRGWARLLAHDYPRALLDTNKALDYTRDAAAYCNRASVHLLLGRYEQALKDSSESIRLRPCAQDYYQRSVILSKLSRLKEAIADLDTAIGLAPDDIGSLYEDRARLYERMGDICQAAIDRDKAIGFGKGTASPARRLYSLE